MAAAATPRGNCGQAEEVSSSFQVGFHEGGSFAGHYGASMTVEHKLITGEIFDQFLSTHVDGLYELIHGEIVEKVPTQVQGGMVRSNEFCPDPAI